MVFNDAGELALQLRSANDFSFPSHWDFSAGGGIDEGEDPKFSAERETREELGVEVKVEFVAEEHFKYPAWNPANTREVELHIFKTHHNGPFTIDTVELEKVEFFTFEKIKEMIDSGLKFHPEFLLLWNKGIIHSARN